MIISPRNVNYFFGQRRNVSQPNIIQFHMSSLDLKKGVGRAATVVIPPPSIVCALRYQNGFCSHIDTWDWQKLKIQDKHY